METNSKTGSYSFVGDYLIALALIGGGVAFVLWISSLSPVERQNFVSGTAVICALILAIPGCLLTVKIINSEKPRRYKILMGVACFGALVIAGPGFIASVLSEGMMGLFGR